MHGLSTPRHVLNEIQKGEDKPWWAGRVFGEIEQVLTGMGVIDQYMSEMSIEALLEEALERVMKPATEAQLMAELRKSLQ